MQQFPKSFLNQDSLPVLIATAVLLTGAGPMTEPKPGIWSAKAVYLWPGPTALADRPLGGRAIEVLSPDGKNTLVVRDGALTVRTAVGSTLPAGSPLHVEDLAEVSWAPDSKAFYVTQSDGGWVGSWYLMVYLLSSDGLGEADISQAALKDFQSRVSGCPEEKANIAAIGWDGGSKKLLLVAEAPPHSSCRDMGKIHGYLVAVPTGEILAKYDRRSIEKSWGSLLGQRLKD